jgi:hypothetical protein
VRFYGGDRRIWRTKRYLAKTLWIAQAGQLANANYDHAGYKHLKNNGDVNVGRNRCGAVRRKINRVKQAGSCSTWINMEVALMDAFLGMWEKST